MVAQTRTKIVAALKKVVCLTRVKMLAKNSTGIIYHQLQEEHMALQIAFHPP